ncbi:MAG: hypothetical protein RIQ93_1832 [Verrucomicrobiota bacterium]|jgi:hypothetical protein
MSKSSLRLVVAAVLLALAVGGGWWQQTARRERGAAQSGTNQSSPPPPVVTTPPKPAAPAPSAVPETRAPSRSPAAQAAEVRKIQSDYEEMVTRVAAEFSAAGGKFPGGLNAYLRQLALLEREKWQDFAAVLSPPELEDLKMTQTRAGKEVQHWLGDAGASEEQRRAVFRLQQEFDERYALAFDFTPAVMARRETQRQELQEAILRQLGPEKFAAWLRVEGPDFARFTTFAEQQSLPPPTALELWRIKNEFIRARLEIAALAQPPSEAKFQQDVAAKAALAKIMAVLGPSAQVAMTGDLLNWLPYK